MARMEPGVNLYSRKVLIEHKCDRILPDWLRFIKVWCSSGSGGVGVGGGGRVTLLVI